MRIALNAVGVLLILVGTVWAGQGAGLIGGSFMTGQRLWLEIGVVAVLIGVALLLWANLRALGS